MAGHSKWAQIKRKKAANDQKRGKMFTKLIREVTVAAREGGGDPEFNPRLRLAVDTAKAANMPADNIDRAIKRGTGELEGSRFEEVSYEGYGPGGVALYIETLTDNANRTVSDLRYILDRNGGNLGQDGCVAWQFERKGQIYIDASRFDEDTVLLAALEAGAEDVRREGADFLVTTALQDFHAVQDGLKAQDIRFDQAELAMVPTTVVPVDREEAKRLLRLLDLLDDAEDVQTVHTNADIPDEVLAQVAT
ncbi:MAG: YebC/PmpR family DNA-binding transcriptional regulator [Longimicrobiales bacterium]